MTIAEPLRLTRKDFVSDQTVRWCPGCGDYAILAQMQKVLPELGIPKEKIVFISGIGCSSRFPYYMDTYGVHSIHGRAPTLASGLKIANPDLSVWVITGDGDGLSIGGNHLLHICRRNMDVNIVLFNNRIYGLTKGQYSPTSPAGLRTKSSPMGTVEHPLNPISVALAAEATFVARTVDVLGPQMGEVLAAAAKHKGVSFVEVFQNCVIFNDGAFEYASERQVRDENNLYLEHGKPMVFGKNKDRGIRMGKSGFEVVELGDGYTEADLVVHDVASLSQAWMLSRMEYPEFPTPMGVILDIDRPVYDHSVWAQVAEAKAKRGEGDLARLYRAADTWTVSAGSNGDEHRYQIQAHIKGGFELNVDEAYIDDVLQAATDGELDKYLSEMTVYELDIDAPITVDASTRMDTALSLMRQHNVGCLLVIAADRHLVGTLTEEDLLRLGVEPSLNVHTATVAQYMTPRPTALHMDAPVVEVLHLMSTHYFRHLAIVDEHNLPVGVISMRDVVKLLAANL